MPTHTAAFIAKYLALLLGNVLLIPLLASAQNQDEVVQVTVTVTAEFEPPALPSTISAAGTASSTVFDQVILPKVETKSEREAKAEEAARRLPRRPRTSGGMFRYERVDVDNNDVDLDGNIYATNFQMAWDIENFSVGFLIPYEYLDLSSFNTHQIGTILYGQYNIRLNPVYTLGFIVNGNYIHSIIDQNIDDINTLGGGVGASLTFDKDIFVVGGAVSYQYNADDTDSPNDHQHLIKLGVNAGVRIRQNSVINLFSTWNYDATDYKTTGTTIDDNYFDLGIEASWSVSRTWSLSGGYKRILGFKDFESNQFFIGTLLRF